MTGTYAIIDDNAGLRYLVALLLERELGVHCSGYGSLDDVVEHAREVLAADVAIIDINLGQGAPDGVAVLSWLRSRGYSGRVFFFTGHAMDSPQVQAAARTGVHVLEKPMTPEELVQVFRNDVLVAGTAG